MLMMAILMTKTRLHILAVMTIVVSMTLTPKPQNPTPYTLNDFDFVQPSAAWNTQSPRTAQRNLLLAAPIPWPQFYTVGLNPKRSLRLKL